MGSQTANLQIPYPVGTDRVADGDNAMQALAEKVDALLWGLATIRIGSPAAIAGLGTGENIFASFTEQWRRGNANAHFGPVSNGSIPILTAGTYLCVGSLALSGVRGSYRIFRNGSVGNKAAYQSTPGDDSAGSMAAVFQMVPGDSVSIGAYVWSTGGTLPADSANSPCYLAVSRLMN